MSSSFRVDGLGQGTAQLLDIHPLCHSLSYHPLFPVDNEPEQWMVTNIVELEICNAITSSIAEI